MVLTETADSTSDWREVGAQVTLGTGYWYGRSLPKWRLGWRPGPCRRRTISPARAARWARRTAYGLIAQFAVEAVDKRVLLRLAGRTVLRSSLIRRVGDRWFMHAQFEFAVAPVATSDAMLGVDRGIVNPVALASVDRIGVVRPALPPGGQEIGDIIRRADARRSREQKRRGSRRTSIRPPSIISCICWQIASWRQPGRTAQRW